MFKKGDIVAVNDQIGVVVRTGQDLCLETNSDLEDHIGIWFGTANGGVAEIWTVPSQLLKAAPLPKLNH